MSNGNTINVPATGAAGLIHAPADAVNMLQQQMADQQFRDLLTADPQAALNQVGINIDAQTADAIRNQIAGGPGLAPNAVITVTAIA